MHPVLPVRFPLPVSDGGTPEKPVGLVYIGCFVMGKVKVEKKCFQGSRADVRAKSVEAALKLLLMCLP